MSLSKAIKAAIANFEAVEKRDSKLGKVKKDSDTDSEDMVAYANHPNNPTNASIQATLGARLNGIFPPMQSPFYSGGGVSGAAGGLALGGTGVSTGSGWDSFNRSIGGTDRQTASPTGGGSALFSGYFFGSEAPKVLGKPAAVDMDDRSWGFVSMYASKSYGNNAQAMADAIKPYRDMGIQDPWTLAVAAHYKLSEEQVRSGNFDFIHDDSTNRRDNRSRFYDLVQANGGNGDQALAKLNQYNDVTSFYAASGRSFYQSYKSIEFLQGLQGQVQDFKEANNGKTPALAFVVDLIPRPKADFNGVFTSAESGKQAAQLSEMRDRFGLSAVPGAQNVAYNVIEGNDDSLFRYTNFIGEQTKASGVDNYRVTLNVNAHGSGSSALLGAGGQAGSLDGYDRSKFVQMGYDLGRAGTIEVNFNSCSNGGFARNVASWIQEGVAQRRSDDNANGRPVANDTSIIAMGFQGLGWQWTNNSTNGFVTFPKNNDEHLIHFGNLNNDIIETKLNVPASPPPVLELTEAEKALERAKEEPVV